MRDEDKLILEICKKNDDGLKITSLIKSDVFKWRYFLEIISKHKIGPLVLNKLMKYPLPQSHRMFLKDLHKKAFVKTTIESRSIRVELTRIQSTLDRNGIESILMKGPSLDFTRLRTIGDLDILIREEKLVHAINVLREIGYIYVGDKFNHLLNSREKRDISLQLSWNNQYQLMNNRTELMVELHTNLFERKRAFTANLDKLLDNIDLFWEQKLYNETLNCFTFSHEHSLLLVCIHNAIKRSPANNAFILRNIIDINNLIERGIHWESFVETTIKLNTAHFVFFSLQLTHKLFDTKIPEDVLIKLENNCTGWQLFLINIHLKCFNSLESNSIFYSILYKFLSPFIYGKRWGDRIKWIFLIPIFFPPKRGMEQYFKLKENSPFVYIAYLLNPFRWIYLIVRNVSRK